MCVNLNEYELLAWPSVVGRYTVFKLRRRMKNSQSCVHVLYKTLNLAISHCCFAEDGREMYQNLKHMQSDCFCSLSLLFCDVVVAVAVVFS